jgi:hypothetical protein
MTFPTEDRKFPQRKWLSNHFRRIGREGLEPLPPVIQFPETRRRRQQLDVVDAVSQRRQLESRVVDADDAEIGASHVAPSRCQRYKTFFLRHLQ